MLANAGQDKTPAAVPTCPQYQLITDANPLPTPIPCFSRDLASTTLLNEAGAIYVWIALDGQGGGVLLEKSSFSCGWLR